MDNRIAEALDILRRTPATLRALLEGPLTGATVNGDREDWGVGEVLGHLIHGENTDWIPRALIILEHGESRPFERFDRFAQFEARQRRSTNELLLLFEQCRSASLETFARVDLANDQWHLKGRHPELGTVTLRELVIAWAVHDLNHLRQIVETLAAGFRGSVGPWKEYLPIISERHGCA